MIDLKQRVAFLNRTHLFSGLKETELAGIATKLEERPYKADEVIFQLGAKPDGFYLIYKGRIKITRPREDAEDFLAWLITGDYFGEEALFENRNRSATVRAVEDSIILFLSREEFDSLLTQYEKLRPNFLVAISSRKLARETRFKWLGPKESIYFLARRHKIRLYQALLAPAFAALLPIILFVWAFLSGAATPVAVGVALLVAVIGWGIWQYIDWTNDYYIVTNQRVVWVERVVGIYDSRQEVPLATILSVNVETDVIGRQLNYGNVTVRTFVGKIQFDYVDHPEQAADMIREYWERTKASGSVAQKEAMKNSIRSKLGLPLKAIEQEALPPIVTEDKEVQKSLLRIVLSNLFKLRIEDGGTVIYHKHWFVLLMQVGKALLFFLGIWVLIFVRIWSLAQSPEQSFLEPNAVGSLRPDSLIVLLLFLTLPFIGWMVWEYVDWKNDTFMVTPDEIIDLDKKPFGTEERRSAQIESILSTEYKRIGLTGYLLNYGTVFIVVGGTKLEFQDVLDPAGVQADINRRRMARIAKKNEETANVERERMAVWLAAYHQNLNEFESPMSAMQAQQDNGSDMDNMAQAGGQLGGDGDGPGES